MEKSSMIRELSEYLNGSKSLDQLEKWTVENIQNAEDSREPDVLALFDDIDGSWMEYREGLIEYPEFEMVLSATLAKAETVWFVSSVPMQNWDLTVDDRAGTL